MGPYPPEVELAQHTANQGLAGGVGICALFGEFSTRMISVFVPRLWEW